MLNQSDGPIFLKESSSASKQLAMLESLYPYLNTEGQKHLKRDIKKMQYGIIGEAAIKFELENSHLPLIVLQDVYLEYEGLSAQIDYLIFTKKLCYVIECKNLYGNIEINNRGEFIRTSNLGKRSLKEGIYSPITQNQRHINLMKKIFIDRKTNPLSKFAVSRYFDDFYKSIVVLANPKTILNNRFAPNEIKKQVIRSDQLINYIIKVNRESKEFKSTHKNTLKLANFYLDLHEERDQDYTKKYNPYRLQNEAVQSLKVTREESELHQQLRIYRLNKSNAEQIKPYYIFTNKQLNSLLEHMPTTIDELKQVKGFGEVKAERYGEEILEILNKR